jgi:putative transposase
MKRLKSARHLQRFVSIHDPIANLFHFPRDSMTATDDRALRTEAMSVWADLVAAA